MKSVMGKQDGTKKRLTAHQETALALLGVFGTCLVLYFCSVVLWPLLLEKMDLLPLSTSAKRAACKKNLVQIASALDQYAADHGGRLPENHFLLVPDYLPALPECSTSKRMSYHTEFGPWKGGGEFYNVVCAGGYHHSEVRFPALHSHLGYMSVAPADGQEESP